MGNCTTCKLREKVHGFDDQGGDFWLCLAVPLVPAFTGTFLRGPRGKSAFVNLNSFVPEHPCHDYQLAKECPLWEADAARLPSRSPTHDTE